MIAAVLILKWFWTWMITPHPLKARVGKHTLVTGTKRATAIEGVAKRLYYKRRGPRVYALYTGR